MITEVFFNHICRVCPQIPMSGAELQLYLVFIVFFLIPQVKYSVMLL